MYGCQLSDLPVPEMRDRWGGGVPLPGRLGGSGERCKLGSSPRGVWGYRPKSILVHFYLERTHLMTRYLVFCDIMCAENDWKNYEILGLEIDSKAKSQQNMYFSWLL